MFALFASSGSYLAQQPPQSDRRNARRPYSCRRSAPEFDIIPKHMLCRSSSRMKSPACAKRVCR